MGIIHKFVVSVIRRNEFQADHFAFSNGHGDQLIGALVKIFKENKANLNPDWMYSLFNHTHPTLLQRVNAIKSYQKKQD